MWLLSYGVWVATSQQKRFSPAIRWYDNAFTTNASIMYMLIQLLKKQLSLVLSLFHAPTTSDHVQLRPKDAIIHQFCIALVMWHHGIFVYRFIKFGNVGSVCQKAKNFSFVLSKPLELWSTPSCLFSLRLMFDCSKLESLRDVSITRIDDTLSYGFPQTGLMRWTYFIYQQFTVILWNRVGYHLIDSLRGVVRRVMQISIWPVTTPRAEPRATNFFCHNPHPLDNFSVQNSSPRVEKRSKNPNHWA